MSASQHIATEAAKFAKEAIRELPPLPQKRNVFIATSMGFAFGPFGVGIYFKSAKDFFICLAMLIVFSMLMVFGLGEVLGWLCSAAYGGWRAHTSNEKIGC